MYFGQVLLVLIFAGESLFNIDGSLHNERKEYLLTVVFNTFVWFQIFNEVNARRVNNEKNVFEGIFKNSIFWGVILITIICQVLLVEFGGEAEFLETDTTSLSGRDWGICIGFGAGEFIWHQIVILVPVDFNDGIQMVNSEVLFRKDPEFEMVAVKTE